MFDIAIGIGLVSALCLWLSIGGYIVDKRMAQMEGTYEKAEE